MSLVASQQARFVRQFVHQWLATQPLQGPHQNIRRGAIAITVGASLTASLCAGLVLWQPLTDLWWISEWGPAVGISWDFGMPSLT